MTPSGGSDTRRSEGEPNDRLTRLCAVMTDALDATPRSGNEKVIVFIKDGDRGGLELHGYDDDVEAMTDLMVHLKALFEANGKQFAIHTLGGEG
jgi:hypothetical protein